MRKIIAALFMTLDGVVEAPGSGDTSLLEHRGWSERFMTPEIGGLIFSQMSASDTMLLGRKTHQEFAAYWPTVPADDPFGQSMNNQAKVVVSTTLDKAEWKNSTLIKDNVVEEISRLKQQPGQTISIVGSPTLTRSLLPYGLIDELQLVVCPIVLGVGKRLFPDGTQKQPLTLIDAKTFSSGVVILSYRAEKNE